MNDQERIERGLLTPGETLICLICRACRKPWANFLKNCRKIARND